METTDLTSEQATTPSKYESIGSAVAAELMIGFWFGIGIILAVTANKMEEETQIQQVTIKDPKKVEAGKKLTLHNRRKREEHSQLA